MPTLPRRLNFSKGGVDAASSIFFEHPAAQKECQTISTLKARTRSRCSSIIKRTASFHAATAGLVARAVTKGGDRRCTAPQGKINLPTIPDLSESRSQTGPPEMVVPSSVAGTGLTTFLTTVSMCPSTWPVLSSGNHEFGARKSRNPLMALTPCASVLAVYSGMMGGFGGATEPVFASNADSRDKQRWFWFVDQWKSCIGWLPTRHWDNQSNQGQVSPWLTMFQVFVIMLLSAMLYRNMEIMFRW